MEDMKYLLSFSFSGIKNIEKKITINFYKKNIDKNFDPSLYRIKSIYGENGAGKTAIITAIKIFKDITLNKNYLTDSENQEFLNHILNKKSSEAFFEVEFMYKDKIDSYTVHKYGMKIGYLEDETIGILEEWLEAKSGNYRNSRYTNLYTVKNGELTWASNCTAAKTRMREKTLNLLNMSSFISTGVFVTAVLKSKKNGNKTNTPVAYTDTIDEDFKLLIAGLNVVIAMGDIHIYLDEEDKHSSFFVKKMFEQLSQQLEKTEDFGKLLKKEVVNNYFGINSKKIAVKEFEQYEKRVHKMEEFIKLFKPQLNTIQIDKKIDGETYYCQLVMDYGEYLVDMEFESTGIKKLVRLYDSLLRACQGGIVFIDELDSNINDIYLCKLIKYFMYHGNGQLCFTTHNVDPMSVLQENKNSIDFLSSDNILCTWNNHGNAAADNAYRNGQIDNLPFNIDVVDFINIFEEE